MSRVISNGKCQKLRAFSLGYGGCSVSVLPLPEINQDFDGRVKAFLVDVLDQPTTSKLHGLAKSPFFAKEALRFASFALLVRALNA